MMTDIPGEIETTLNSLKANNFDARFAQTATEAREMLLKMIPLEATVAIGDSATLRQLGVPEELVRRGTKVINPFIREISEGMLKNPAKHELFRDLIWKTFGADFFLCSSNAVTKDGKIVSIDSTGNRVAAMIHGASRVILTISRNKIVEDVDEAIYRIKNVIAPAHAKRKGRSTPCTKTGRCSDCNSPDRICNVTVILEKNSKTINLSVVLINEDLGLGWSPDYEEERINEIRAKYSEQIWPF